MKTRQDIEKEVHDEISIRFDIEGMGPDDLDATSELMFEKFHEVLTSLIQEVEGMKKSVLDLFPEAKLSIPTEENAWQCIAKEMHNQALSAVLTLLKQAKEQLK